MTSLLSVLLYFCDLEFMGYKSSWLTTSRRKFGRKKAHLPRKCRKIPRGVATYVNHVMAMIYASKRLPRKVAKDGVDFFLVARVFYDDCIFLEPYFEKRVFRNEQMNNLVTDFSAFDAISQYVPKFINMRVP